MRIHSMLGVVLMLGVGMAAKGEDLTLTIYTQGAGTTDLMTLAAAKGVTTKIFAGIGVRVRWATGNPRKTDDAAIVMQFDAAAPARFRPDALAYATPFDDSHSAIHIFYDRVLRSVPHQRTAAVLGHVMAHEIGHVLERVDRHSEIGVMKAHWTIGDYEQMAVRPLPFAAENVEMMRAYWGGQRLVSAR